MSVQVAAENPSPVLPFGDPSRKRRLVKVVVWLVGIALVVVLLNLLGIDILGWLQDLWDQIKDVPPGYIVSALLFQTGQTVFAGASYYGILSAAYPGEVQLAPVVTAYAVGVSMNNFLPANIGTFVTLLMFVAIIPSCTFAGAVAAYLVQKIFFTIAGTFVYLYLFLSVPGSFNVEWQPLRQPGGLDHNRRRRGVLARGPRPHLLASAEEAVGAGEEGRRDPVAAAEILHARLLPRALASWLCKLAVIAIFLAAFAIPVTFESVMWITGSGSLANTVSVTPGAVGITQATNALALDKCCDVAESVTINYSTAQQLITTAWNVLFAVVLVVWVFGWTGGKLLVGQSYSDAKVKVAEQKEQRAAKKEAKQAERKEEGAESLLDRVRPHRGESNGSKREDE